MILFDISAAFHMVTHRLAKTFHEGEKVNLLDYRKEFYKGMLWIIDLHTKMFSNHGDPVICIDNKSKATWRKDYYPMYKSTRKQFRDSQSTFSYSDAYVLFDEFLDACEKYACIKCVSVPGAEADDIILVLGEHLANQNIPVMVLSPDKDFIQLQKSPLVKQYSWNTKKMVAPEDKGHMDLWLLEHVCLGDATDTVPRIVDFQKFKPGVEDYLKSKGIHDTPYEFSWRQYDPDEFLEFGGVFDNEKFGPATLKKLIQKHGSLESLLESNPIIKNNYERNKKLVLMEGIPDYIKHDILEAWKEPPTCNVREFAKSLGLEITDLPSFLQNKYLEMINLDW